MKRQQRGGTIIGLILGLIVGLGVALGVAIYVSKVPVPFLNKGAARGSDQDAAEAEKNRNWDPNQLLRGKNAAPTASPAPPATVASGPVAPNPAQNPVANPPATAAAPKGTASQSAPPTAAAKPSADPLGDLATARAKAAPPVGAAAPANAGGDPFDYFVQAGSFGSQSSADAQRAKLAMLGWEARVSEREQNGRTVFRVRVGPFTKRDDAEQLKGKLEGAGVESALVRVQRN